MFEGCVAGPLSRLTKAAAASASLTSNLNNHPAQQCQSSASSAAFTRRRQRTKHASPSVLRICCLWQLAGSISYASYASLMNGQCVSPAPDRLRVASMNVSGCRPSAVAPQSWSSEKQQSALEFELFRRSMPDILALQECPSATWAEEAFPKYRALGSALSHAGFVTLMLQRDAPFRLVQKLAFGDRNLPAVIAELAVADNSESRFFVGSVHLEPFTTGENVRQDQLLALLAAMDKASSTPSSDETKALVLAGDTNMRVKEDSFAEQVLHLRDAWKESGADAATKFTWNTIDRRSTIDGKHKGFFNEYYGAQTRQYTARYDRVYFKSPDSTGATLHPVDFQLLASTPISPSNNHFLSDHFGIYAEFQLSVTSPVEPLSKRLKTS